MWYQIPVNISSPNYPGNYPNYFDQDYSVKFPGAKWVRIHFDDFNTETNYDFVYIYRPVFDNFVDENGDNFVDENDNSFSAFGFLSQVQVLHGNLGPNTTLIISGDTAYWNFSSDGSVTQRGWHVDYIEGEYELESAPIGLELKFDKPLPNDWPPDVYPQNFEIELSVPAIESYPVPNPPILEFFLTFSIPTIASYPIPVLPKIEIGGLESKPVILTRRFLDPLPPIYREFYLLELKETEYRSEFYDGVWNLIPNDIVPIYVPMASCQLTKSIDDQNFISAVIPNAQQYLEDFATKTILTIYHVIEEINTGLLQKDILATVKLDDLSITHSPSDYSASIKGHLLSGTEYSTAYREKFRQVMGIGIVVFSPIPIRIYLKKVRSVNIRDGKISVECNIDPFLNPKFYAVLPDGTEFIVGRISIRLTSTLASMTVEER